MRRDRAGRRALLLLLLAGCTAPGDDVRPTSSLDHLFAPGGGRFLRVSSYDTTGGNQDRHEIAPGDSVVLLDLEGPGVVRRMWLTVSSRDDHYLRRIALKMYWEGESEPSVWVPLGDFFGNGFDRRHYAALPMGVSSGGFFSYLPLPFADRARIVAVNGTGRVVDAFYFNADVELEADLPSPLATFHATWNRDVRTTEPSPHLVLDAHGRGRFVGMSLNAESYGDGFWYLEGDEIFHVDGEFRGQGTGTEDYFNGGWYFDQGEFAAPYHGVVVKDDALGRVAAYRWHLPDPVGFRDSIRLELEHGHANEVVADYATVAYWYQVEPHEPLPPLPEPDARRVLGVKMPPGTVVRSEYAVREEGNGRRVISVQPPRADRYEVVVYPMGGPQGGTATLRLLDPGPTSPTPRSIDLEAAERREILPPVSLGPAAATVGSVELEVQGGEAALPAGVELRPVRTWAREWMVVGPFPNAQRLGTEYSEALDRTDPPEEDPSLDRAYPLPGGGSARWAPVDGDETGYVRLNPHFQPSDWVSAFAQAWLFSPREQDAVLLLGADDGHVLWVDGVEVSRRQGRHIAVPDEMEVPVELRQGWNRVLLEVADLDGGWAFHLRAADPRGELRWARRPPPQGG